MRSSSREDRRAAFVMLGRTLAEADVSVSRGDVRGIEVSVRRVGKAFDMYWSRCQDEIEGEAQTPLEVARCAALQALAALLGEIDQSLSRGELEDVRAALTQAIEAVEATARLQEAPKYSEIRSRFPQRSAK
jgi:hypothetical protein